MVYKKILIIILLLLIILKSHAQQTFTIDTIYFKNEVVRKVKIGDNDIWAIKGADSSQIGKINSSGIVSDLTNQFKALTNKPFSSICFWKNDTVLVGTYGDYVLKYHGGQLSKLGKPNGILHPNVNSIISSYYNIRIGTDSLFYYSENGQKFATFGDTGTGFLKISFESHKGSPDILIQQEKYYDDTLHKFYYSTPSTMYGGTIVSRGIKDINSVLLIGEYSTIYRTFAATNKGVLRHGWTNHPYVIIDKFFKDTVCYKFNKVPNYYLLGTEKGLFIFDDAFIFNAPRPFKKVDLGEEFAIYDIDIKSVGCRTEIWLASNKGLIKLIYIPVELNVNNGYGLCPGEKHEVRVVNESCFNNFQWQKDEIDIPGAIEKTYSITQPGNYKVKCTDVYGGVQFSKNINTPTEANFSTSIYYSRSRTLCLGDTILLEGNKDIYYEYADTKYTYQWYKNGAPISGQTKRFLKAFDKGIYYLKMTSCGGVVKDSHEVEIFIESLDKEIIRWNSKQQYCFGDSIELSAYDPNIKEYKWKVNNKDYQHGWSGIYAKEPGFYQVFTKYYNGCSSRSDSVFIQFKNPSKLEILRSNDSLIAVYEKDINPKDRLKYAYLWYINEVPLWASASKKILPSETGNYKVTVQEVGFCKVISNSFFYKKPDKKTDPKDTTITTGAEENLSFGKAIIYPNPGNGFFNVKLPSGYVGEIEVKIYNFLGIQLLRQSHKIPWDNILNLNLTDLPENSYWMVLSNKNHTEIKKLIINRKI